MTTVHSASFVFLNRNEIPESISATRETSMPAPEIKLGNIASIANIKEEVSIHLDILEILVLFIFIAGKSSCKPTQI